MLVTLCGLTPGFLGPPCDIARGVNKLTISDPSLAYAVAVGDAADGIGVVVAIVPVAPVPAGGVSFNATFQGYDKVVPTSPLTPVTFAVSADETVVPPATPFTTVGFFRDPVTGTGNGYHISTDPPPAKDPATMPGDTLTF